MAGGCGDVYGAARRLAAAVVDAMGSHPYIGSEPLPDAVWNALREMATHVGDVIHNELDESRNQAEIVRHVAEFAETRARARLLPERVVAGQTEYGVGRYLDSLNRTIVTWITEHPAAADP